MKNSFSESDSNSVPESSWVARFAPIIVTLIFSLVSILLHRFWCGTPVSSPEERWQEILEYHRTFYPFSIRYFTTWLVIGSNQLTHLPVRETFLTIQYLLMGSVGFLYYRFLQGLKLNGRLPIVGLVLFLTAFPILFAHSEPVFTWDDGWTYLLLLLCVSAMMGRHFCLAAVWFTIGCFAREQMLLYVPLFVYGVIHFGADKSVLRKATWIGLPVVIYGIFYAIVYQTPDQQRYQLWQYNFSSGPITNNTLFSLFISFGAIWLAWLVGLSRNTDAAGVSGGDYRFIRIGSMLAVVPTVVVGLTLAYARETRIFFPPFLLVIPIALLWVEQSWQRLTSIQRQWTTVTVVSVIGLSVLAVRVWQPDLDFRNCPEFCHNWLGVQLGLSIGIALLALVSGRRNAKHLPQ